MKVAFELPWIWVKNWQCHPTQMHTLSSEDVFSSHNVSAIIGSDRENKWAVMTTFSFKVPMQFQREPLWANIALSNKASDKH